tara:strand:- start:3074 stop:3250 length:177 start_codon:yes stop_codon:yes gene_type:complete
MKVGDLVKMKDTRFHKEIGVGIEIKKVEDVGWQMKIHWADGRVLWESKLDLTPVKKCP